MSFTGHDWIMVGCVLAAMLSLLWGAGKLSARFGIAPETKRKSIHVLTGLISLSFPWLFSSPLPVILMIVVSLLTMAALRSPIVKNHSMSTVLHDVQRQSFGEFYILISIGFLFAHSVGNPVLYVLPLTVIALSDTGSALIGTKYGKKRLSIFDGEKTIEGSVAFFIITLLVSLILLMLLTDMAEVNLIILSSIIAAFCTFIESDSWEGLDNLFVPVGAHILLVQLFDATPSELITAFAMMITAIVVMNQFAPLLKLTTRTARAYTLLIILFTVVRPNPQVIFPLMAIVGHFFSRTSHPALTSKRDFEMIAATATVAMIWMFADILVPESAIDLFNLTYAAAAVIFVGLAFNKKWRILIVPFALLTGAFYIYTTNLRLNATVWMEHDLILPTVSIGLAVACVYLRPKMFDRHRSVKSYAISIIAPAVCFIFYAVLT